MLNPITAVKRRIQKIKRGHQAYNLGLKLALHFAHMPAPTSLAMTEQQWTRKARWYVRNSNRLYNLSGGRKPTSINMSKHSLPMPVISYNAPTLH